MDEIIIFCAKYVIVFVALGALVALVRVQPSRRWHLALTIIVGGVIALVFSRIATKLYYDPRPFVQEGVKPLISHAADNGFPSDHSLLAMALTAAVFFFHKKVAAGMLLLTFLIGAARVLAKVHSPIDIVGAWLIAIAGVAAAYIVLRYAASRLLKRA